MAYGIGGVLGALAITYLLTRLALWLLKRMGDDTRRILVAYAAVFVFSVMAGGYGLANGGTPDFLRPALLYGLPLLLWLVVDFLALKGRRARRTDAPAA
jgi:hypothetical protein